ncbi:hypothetical protein [Nocardia sp. NPDC005366]|uniref:hypothetical protein n=1 Tax=Nocardia sp. NPDC005366 TaxID=3156878 RepID=UPI0033BD75F9
MTGIGATEPLELIDQAFSVGAAVELLLKAALTSVDIHLIREGRSGHPAVGLALSGFHRKPSVPPLPDIRTVGPVEASVLLAMLGEQKFPQARADDLKLVNVVRDSAVHMGLVDTQTNERAVTRMVKLVDWVLEARRMLNRDDDRDAYWAEYWADYEAQASDILKARNEQIFTMYERKISAAKARFAKLTSTDAGRSAVAYLEEGEEGLEVYEISRRTPCPACDSRGRTIYNVVVQSIIAPAATESEQDSAFRAVTSRPRQFHCGVCNLVLVGDDLEAAQIVDEAQLEEWELTREGFVNWLMTANADGNE